MIIATRFDNQLRITAFKAITEQLIQHNLITKDEATKIKAEISRMEDSLIPPERSEKVEHSRDLEVANDAL